LRIGIFTFISGKGPSIKDIPNKFAKNDPSLLVCRIFALPQRKVGISDVGTENSTGHFVIEMNFLKFSKLRTVWLCWS